MELLVLIKLGMPEMKPVKLMPGIMLMEMLLVKLLLVMNNLLQLVLGLLIWHPGNTVTAYYN